MRAPNPTDPGFRQLAMLDLSTGATTPLTIRPDAVTLSSDEARVATAHFTGDCILWPDGHACHAQLWALSVWTEAAGLVELARASQPITPLWIGDDGTMLASGRFYREPPPASAPQEDPEPAWQLVLFAPDGSWLRDLGEDDVSQVHAGSGALLLVRRRANEELHAVNTATGASAMLAEGRTFAVGVDATGTRTAFAYRALSAATRTLEAGAIPRP